MRARAEARPSVPEPVVIEGIYYYEGHKYPRYVNIPPELIDATDEDGIRRATFIELRVRNILRRQSDIIKSVFRNKNGSKEDDIGHDLTVTLKGNPPVRIVHIQVKADRQDVVEYKRRLMKEHFGGGEIDDNLISNWLTKQGIILLNGTDGKSEAEILKSFYPQLARIQQKALREQVPEPSGQMTFLFPKPKQIQIFPEAL